MTEESILMVQYDRNVDRYLFDDSHRVIAYSVGL